MRLEGYQVTRVTLLDGLRGYFLINMFIRHTQWAPNDPLSYLTISRFGFAQSPHGFVFLSGVLVGLLYFTSQVAGADPRSARKLIDRSREIYVTSMITVAFLLALAIAVPLLGGYWIRLLGPLLDLSPAALAATAALLYQPGYLDVLPQYVFYMLAAPLFFLGVRKYGLMMPMIISLILWAAVQGGAHTGLSSRIDDQLYELHPDLRIKTGFNIFAWQLLFFFGVACGVVYRQDNSFLRRIFDERRLWAPLIALAGVIGALLLQRHMSGSYAPGEVPSLLLWLTKKSALAPVPAADFLAKAYLLTWLLVAGPRSSVRLLRGLSRVVSALGNLAYLRLLGRHSLQVYAWHVPVTYFVIAAYRAFPEFGTAERTMLVIAGLAALALPSLIRESALYLRLRRRSPARA
jgi:hypothetical protein